jgi:hypothetical protein
MAFVSLRDGEIVHSAGDISVAEKTAVFIGLLMRGYPGVVKSILRRSLIGILLEEMARVGPV